MPKCRVTFNQTAQSSSVMASEQWPAWFRLTVISGVKVIVKKYVSGINLSDCIGDLITQHLDDKYSGRTIASI